MTADATTRPAASVSLDVDNLWSYLKVHGDAGWESFPSYLDRFVPRVLSFLASRPQRITFFVVGQDAALDRNREFLGALAAAGHEIGNHSFSHEPWIAHQPEPRVEDELSRAEEAIEQATGVRPQGFRGPGFAMSRTMLSVLARRGYRYDASSLPTFVGPAARAWYFLHSRLGRQQRQERAALFGTLRDGLRPLGAYRWSGLPADLLEVPVTTVPGIRTPFHLSYILFLASFSPALGRAYFRGALAACRALGVEPSILLHPLDFLGGDECPELAFFPAMNLPTETKLARVAEALDDLGRSFEVLPLGEHARRIAGRPDLPSRPAGG